MRLYDDSHHGGESQNFGVATEGRGRVYVGNLHGLLISNGAQWRLSPSEVAIYAVAVDARGKVVAGGPQSLFTLEPGPSGAATLRSITHPLPPEDREFGDVRSIVATSEGFFALTDLRLFFYDGRLLKSIAVVSRESPTTLFAFRGHAYLGENASTKRAGPTGLSPAPEFAALSGQRIDAILDEGQEKEGGPYLAVLREMGLVRVGDEGVAILRGAASEWAKTNVISAAIRLRDGRIALGSRTGGVLLIGRNAEAEQIVDSRRGLPDDHVTGLAEDREGGLWVTLNAGLARLDVASPITLFDARAGMPGGAQGVHRHDGRLYVMGSAGLGVIEGGTVKRIPGVAGSTWSGLTLSDLPGEFLLAAAAGVFRVAGDRATLVPGTADLGAYVLAEAQGFRGVLVGARSGLHLLIPEGLGFRLIGPLAGSPRYVRSIVTRPEGRAYFASVFDGIVAVDFDPQSPAVAQFRKLGGIEGDVHLSPGGLIAVTNHEKSEVFGIDEAEAGPRLVPNAAVTGDLVGRVAWVGASDAEGRLWINTSPLRVFPRRNGVLLKEPVVLYAFPARRIQFIRPEADGVVWVGGEGGLYRHVGAPGGGLPPPPAPTLARISLNDRVIFDGFREGAVDRAALPHNLRRLHVEFGPLSHQRGLAFQFRLDPMDVDWSEWSPRTEVEFTTLQEAEYRFRVRTRGPDGQVGPETAWSFVVDPPWYRTMAARLAAVLGVGLIVVGGVWVGTRVLRLEAARLSRMVEEKTRDLQLAVAELEAARLRVLEQNHLLEEANARLEDVSRHDALTGIANRRQFDEVLNDEWGRARRQRTPLAVGILDLDHFKEVNDAFGHPEGDEALKRVARALEAATRRPADLVARYGGEEFAFVLTETDLAGALQVAEDMRSRVEALNLRNPAAGAGHLTASIGLVAAVPAEGLSVERLIGAADRALYSAKGAGRNRVRAAEISGE